MNLAFANDTTGRLATVGLSVSVSACATPQARHSANTPLPDHWRHTQSHADTASIPAVELREWWKPFHEITLDRLVTEVAASNLSIREATERLAAARALERASAAEFRPSVHLATIPVDTPDARASYLQGGLEVTWPFGLFGRASAAAEVARADTNIAEAFADGVRASVIAETVRAYIEWRADRAVATNLDAQIAAQTERVDLMGTRVRLRLSTPGDENLDKARLRELRSQHLALDRALADVSERIAVLLATADGTALDDSTLAGQPSLSPFRIREIPADLLRNRTDVRRAEHAVIEATAQLHLDQADLYPRLTLGGSLTLALPIAGSTNSAARTLASVGPAIEIPLFDWGRRRAIVTAQDHALEAALLAYRQSILVSVHEVESALAAFDSLSRDTELRCVAARSAAEEEKVVSAAQHLQRASRLDLLAAQLTRLEADARLLDAERECALAYVVLCQALGGVPPPAAT